MKPEKVVHKGMKVLTNRNGSVEYKPFVVYERKLFGFIPLQRTYFITIGHGNGNYYLSRQGFITRDTLQNATHLLDSCISKYDAELKRDYDKTVIHSKDILI